MPVTSTNAIGMNAATARLTFFRQSGWMVIATVSGGAFMYAVHKVAGKMPKAEYGVFLTLLQVFNQMQIPALGLQTIFAQQAVAAAHEGERGQLTAAVRAVAIGTFLLWLAMAVGAFVIQDDLIRLWKISNPAAVWATVLLALGSMWLPMMMGVLQGRQNFLWLGWAGILNGVGRFVAITLIVLFLGGYAAGAMFGAVAGLVVAMAVAVWQTRDVWFGESSPFEWRAWLGRVVPLTLGLGASQFMFSADMIVVQTNFDKDMTGLYGAAGMIGRALVTFTAPMMAVMFPKVAQSAARAEKTNVLAQALGATALLGSLAALACTLFPELPLRLVYDKSFLVIAPLVPWFAWCMLPLTLANVLISSLLARRRYEAVPWLVLVALAYGLTLFVLSPHFQQAGQTRAFQSVVQTLGVFGLVLLAVSAWFTWGGKRTSS